MNRRLKVVATAALLGSLLFGGCKKSSLPSETASSVKSYDFFAVGGIKTPDNGFLLICNEIFNLLSLNDKVVKLNSNGGIDWQYSFSPTFVNDSNFNFITILDITATSGGYYILAAKDSVYPSGKALGSRLYPYFIGLTLSGQLMFEKSIYPKFFKPAQGILAVTSGNILQLTNGNWLLGINNPVNSTSNLNDYYKFKLTSTGSLLTLSVDTPGYKMYPQYTSSINKMINLPSGNVMMTGTNSYASLWDSSLTFKKNEMEYGFTQSYFPSQFTSITPVNGNYFLSGFADIGTLSSFHYNFLMAMVDENLKPVWPTARTTGNVKQNYCLSAIVTGNNNLAMIGVSNYESTYSDDYASSVQYIRVDVNGNLLSEQTLATGLGAGGILISQNPDGSYLIVGSKLAYAGNPNFFQTIFIHTTIP